MKTAFLISGFSMNSTAADPDCAELRKAIREKGYKVLPAPILWNHKTVSEFTDEFVGFYNRQKTEKNIVIGNSFGAAVAFVASQYIHPDRVFLCSLSPCFKEDRSSLSERYSRRIFGKKRQADFKKLSANEIADKINRIGLDVTLLYGEKEKEKYPPLVKRVKDTAKTIVDSKLIEIPNGPHSFDDPVYIKAIQRLL